MSSLEGTACEKCFGGVYGKARYDKNWHGYHLEKLVYTCDVCGHEKETDVKPKLKEQEINE